MWHLKVLHIEGGQNSFSGSFCVATSKTRTWRRKGLINVLQGTCMSFHLQAKSSHVSMFATIRCFCPLYPTISGFWKLYFWSVNPLNRESNLRTNQYIWSMSVSPQSRGVGFKVASLTSPQRPIRRQCQIWDERMGESIGAPQAMRRQIHLCTPRAVVLGAVVEVGFSFMAHPQNTEPESKLVMIVGCLWIPFGSRRSRSMLRFCND